MNQEFIIKCSSEEEMNRVADQMLEKGYEVERLAGVLPLPVYCGKIYRVRVSEKGKTRTWLTRMMEVLLLLFWGMFCGMCLWSLTGMESAGMLLLSIMACILILLIVDKIMREKSCKV